MKVLEGTEQFRARGTQDAAKYCAVSAEFLRKLRAGRNPEADAPQHTMIGRRVVYLQEDLDAWLERQRASTISNQGAA